MVSHRFLPNSNESTIKSMLTKLQLQNVDDLFSDVPERIRLKRGLRLPDALSEFELERLIDAKLSKNRVFPVYLNFLGGGIRLHHIPSIIDEILSRGEFYTAYTPYQPEISQGMLQSLFEYQSQICELTAMDAANSSMYDWGSALGEAGRMAHRVTGRKKILYCRNTSPERISVLHTYCSPVGIELEPIDFERTTGEIDLYSLKSKLNSDVAAVYLENPNYFGVIERFGKEIGEACHSLGALFMVGTDPVTLGVIKPPGDYGADIVVGDGQMLGLYPNFGGPLIGIFATRDDPALLRQMPGRLIGVADSKDQTKRGYTMILQTREQHIRRENATSNICTNEALLALAVSIYLAALGPTGMKEIGERMALNSHYAMKRLQEEGLVAPFFSGSFLGDLTVRTTTDSRELPSRLLEFKILGGLPMGSSFEELKEVSLFSFSEIHSTEDIEKLAVALRKVEAR